MATVTAPTFDHINRHAGPYPAFLLPHGGTALALFSAGFHGWNDVIHFARKGMEVSCVDIDGDRLWQMAEIYPNAWAYHVEDAWEFAQEAAAKGRTWDVVSVDSWTFQMPHVADTAPLWCSLAERLVTLAAPLEPELFLPDGWTLSTFPRNERVSWAVLQPC